MHGVCIRESVCPSNTESCYVYSKFIYEVFSVALICLSIPASESSMTPKVPHEMRWRYDMITDHQDRILNIHDHICLGVIRITSVLASFIFSSLAAIHLRVRPAVLPISATFSVRLLGLKIR